MTGVACSAAYSAIGTIFMYSLDRNQLEFLQRWQSGELWGTDWNYIIILFIWLSVFGGAIYGKSYTLNAINIGYNVAKGIGVNTKRDFVILAIGAIAISSASVAFGGNFFFLGLIGPHIAKKLVGVDTRVLFLASGTCSAIIILVADMLVMGVDAFANIPTGIFVSILSVPYFIYLLIKRSSYGKLYYNKRLKVAYDDFVVIPDFNIEIKKGKMTSIIGANGCGKSTVLKAIGRVFKAESGNIIINDKDIFKMKNKDIAKEMAILPQTPTAPGSITLLWISFIWKIPLSKRIRDC